MIKRITLSLLLLVLIALPNLATEASYQSAGSGNSNPARTAPSDGRAYIPFIQNSPTVTNNSLSACHFGLALLTPWTSFDVSTLGIGNYVDWGSTRNPSIPANIDYNRVLYVGDSSFLPTLARLPALLASNPGSVWIIGNEPDSEVTYQDHIAPEIYGERFYDLATLIRKDDPTAKIAFGPVIEPTPVRIYYLTQALNRVAQLAGGMAQAHALIDVYTIHGFILNEAHLYDSTGKAISWGAGLPVGYDPATWPAPELIHPELGETWKIYDLNTFTSRLINFRQWMKDQGEQNKPLWITEFGVLFPPEGNPYLYVSDAVTANFMAQAFDFMLGHKDPQLGYAADDNRLVQRWTWFSLNGRRNAAGGSLFDPTNNASTVVGDRYAQYDPSLSAVPVTNPTVYVLPNSLAAAPVSISNLPGRVNYIVSVKVGNQVSSDRRTGVMFNLYEGSTLIGSVSTEIPRCGGNVKVGFLMKDLLPGQSHTFSAHIALLPGNGVDNNNAANNQISFPPITMPNLVPRAFIPLVLQ